MTDTLAPEARRNLVFSREVGALNGVKKYRQGGNGNLILEGVAVFRSGTFRDSMGFQHQWEPEHMTQMVDNYTILSSRGVITSVPIRSDHVGFLDSSLKSVVGYHIGIRTEERINSVSGEMCTYLLADMEIIDPDAIQKIESGLWRNLSSEIGTYLTNAEAEYWPVYMGVAFVDFPAVEGLANSFSKRAPNDSGIHAGSAVFSLVNEQEDTDMGNINKGGTVTEEKVKEGEFGAEDIESQAQNITPNDSDGEGANDEDETEVQNGEAGADSEASASEDGVYSSEDAGTEEGDEAGEDQPNAEHGLNSGQSFQFSINGQPTTDFAAVQAHITSLEATIEHGRQQGIEEFVKALSDEGKILATQVDSLTDFAKSLTESQYTAWAGQYGDMPSLPLFGHHGAGANRIENPKDMEKSEEIKNELGIQREILASHQKVKSSPLPKVEAKIKELEDQLSDLEGN